MIACSSPLAKTPFELNHGQLQIYSLEELCCFYDESEFFTDESVVNEIFCDWVERELGLAELAKKLRRILETGKTSECFLKEILESNDFLTEERTKELLYQLSQYDAVSALEKRKLYADSLLRNREYNRAVKAYYDLLEDVKEDDRKLAGKIWNNLGTAYGRMFYFSQAQSAFERAYELNPDERVLDELVLTKQLMNAPANHCGPGFDGQEVSEEALEELKEEYRRMAR